VTDSDGFGTDNLPYGVDDDGHVVVAWGDQVIDLTRATGLDVGREVWASGSLNAFFALGPEACDRTRAQLQTKVGSRPGPSWLSLGDVTGRVVPNGTKVGAP
jgi:hypothetical protein